MTARWFCSVGICLSAAFLLSSASASYAQDLPPSDVLRQRVRDLEENARDTAIQIEALTELVDTAPAKINSLDLSVQELQRLKGELEKIQQNNLIKLLLTMSYEVYNTVDGVASGGKAAIESFVNVGIRYTLGRLAFENGGAAAQKALGLDSSNYLGARSVALRRLTEEALTQSAEVAKVHVALSRGLDYYRALVEAEQGEDPGERGAVLRKNIVVRQQIIVAIDALNSMKSTAVSQVSQAESDLDWLQGEAESIDSLLAGVRLQLKEAEAFERETRLENELAALLAQRVVPEPPAPFSFNYPPPQEDDPDYHHNYHTARYNEGAARINALLDTVVPELTSIHKSYQDGLAEALDSQKEVIEAVQFTTKMWENVDQLAADSFHGLAQTYYDVRDTREQLDELQQKRKVFSGCIDKLKALEPLLAEFNNAKARAIGCQEIATASAYLVSEAVPAGQTPRPVLGTYSFDQFCQQYGYYSGMPWGGENFATLPNPASFESFYTTLDELESWEIRVDRAAENLEKAREAFENHLTGLQSAFAAEFQAEKQHQQLLTDQTGRLTDRLNAAERLCTAQPFCAYSAVSDYLNIHTHFFNVAKLSQVMANAIRDNSNSVPARALWQSYLAFIPKYQSIAIQYQSLASDVLQTIYRRESGITAIRTEYESACGAAETTGESAPSPALSAISAVEEAYYEALQYTSQIKSFETARTLPECSVLDPMPQPSVIEKPWLNDPLVQAVPVLGLVLIQEDMESEFQRLMDKTTRDEEEMWSVSYEIAARMDEWKAGHTSVPLAYNFHHVADLIKDARLYSLRMEWEEAFSAPRITRQSGWLAIAPGSTGTLFVEATSTEAFTATWYRDVWFGDDEVVGDGSTLTVAAPEGLEQYYCVLVNPYGRSQTTRIDAFPAAPPKFATQPQGCTVASGSPAQISVTLYLTTGAGVEQSGSWYVSNTDDPASGYRQVPDSSNLTLNLRSVTSGRWYYYEASNPWGTTRSDAVLVTTTTAGKPKVLSTPSITLYLGVPFFHQLDGVQCQSFELTSTAPAWLLFDKTTGVFSGTPRAEPGSTVQCKVRGIQVQAGKTNYSDLLTLTFSIRDKSEWPGPRALRHFSQLEALDPAIGGPNADPDGDGIPNRWEYLLGTSPTTPNTQESMPMFRVEKNRAVLAFRRIIDRTDLRCLIQTSTDLQHWEPIVALADNIVENADGTETVTYEVSGTEQVFVRLTADLAE